MLFIGKHGNMPSLGARNWLKGLVGVEKEIGTSISMMVKHFRIKTIMGHWYLIVSIHCHDHAMTDMMVLRHVYALVV